MGLFKKKKSPRDWSSEGGKLIQERKYEEAIECYDKALELESTDVDLTSHIWNQKGTAFIKLERYEDAIRCPDKALVYDSCPFVSNKAYALLVLGRYDELINYPDKFCGDVLTEKSDPLLPLDVLSEECGFVSLYKGFALENLKKYEEAMEWFDNALKIFFSDEEMYELCKKDDPELLYVTYEEFALASRDILHDLLKKTVENDKKITEDIGMSDGHGITPWWLFIIDLISLLTDLLGDEFPLEGASGKLINFFKEFNRAPRISDSFAIEFEDFINDDSEDSSMSSYKEEIMAVFEQWRELKLEGRL